MSLVQTNPTWTVVIAVMAFTKAKKNDCSFLMDPNVDNSAAGGTTTRELVDNWRNTGNCPTPGQID
jgi:hypothetical protein